MSRLNRPRLHSRHLVGNVLRIGVLAEHSLYLVDKILIALIIIDSVAVIASVDVKSSRTAASSLFEMHNHRRRRDSDRRALDHDHIP